MIYSKFQPFAGNLQNVKKHEDWEMTQKLMENFENDEQLKKFINRKNSTQGDGSLLERLWSASFSKAETNASGEPISLETSTATIGLLISPVSLL